MRGARQTREILDCGDSSPLSGHGKSMSGSWQAGQEAFHDPSIVCPMKKAAINRRTPKSGFALLEVLLAFAVFSVAATGFVVALHRTAKLANLTQRELKITRVLESALHEALSLPRLEEGKTTLELEDGSGMQVDTLIEPIDWLENQDGQMLQNMWKITVTVYWLEGDQWQERSAETWRYGRLYQQ